jgi:hypothetical protein
VITKDDIENGETNYESQHAMGTQGGIGRGYRYVKYPRLKRIDRWWSNPREFERQWFVDGVEHPTLEAALFALNLPVFLTAEEKAALERIPDEYVSYHAVWAEIAGEPVPQIIERGTPVEHANWLLDSLRNKGMIEFLPTPKGIPQLRRTAAARSEKSDHK